MEDEEECTPVKELRVRMAARGEEDEEVVLENCWQCRCDHHLNVPDWKMIALFGDDAILED